MTDTKATLDDIHQEAIDVALDNLKAAGYAATLQDGDAAEKFARAAQIALELRYYTEGHVR